MIILRAKDPSRATTKVEARGQKAIQQPASLEERVFNPQWQRLALGVQAKLSVSAPDDPYEREADQTADQVMRMPERLSGEELRQAQVFKNLPALPLRTLPVEEEKLGTGLAESARSLSNSAEAGEEVETHLSQSKGQGSPLPADVRSYMEPRFGVDFSQVRIHTGNNAVQMNRDVRAQAFTHGPDIYYGAGSSPANMELTAHELTHVMQQHHHNLGFVQRQEQPTRSGGTSPAPQPSVNINLIPPERVQQPDPNDLLVAIYNHRMVALPALGAVVFIQPPAGGVQPVEPLFTVPTVAKEGVAAVNVGGRVGFQIDAGGRPAVVFPTAMAAMQQALGIETIRGVLITHLHSDHVQSLVSLVRDQQIRPEGIFYPTAYTANPNAPTSTLARGIRVIQTDPSLQALGHGPQARYQAIPTPAGGAFFQQTIREGQVRIEIFGLTREFQQLEQQRQQGQQQPRADTTSLLTRVTHEMSGTRVLFVSDLRGSDLALFRQAMGEQRYNELVTGVRVIHGFQHHMGASDNPADRAGLIDLVTRTQMRSGDVSVVVQSQERYSGRQFLNRSLIRALQDIGVNVHLALEPQSGQVGTITAYPEGNITRAGGGRMESHAGSQEMQLNIRRLAQLAEAEEILTRYGQYVVPTHRHTERVREARQQLQAAMNEYVEASINGVQVGASGRAQASLTSSAQAVQAQILTRLRTFYPIEEHITPAYLEALREVNRLGPYRQIFEQEMAEARRTGRVSERGIAALWELDPELARRLVRSSGLSRAEQRRVSQSLPGQSMPLRTRVAAGFMLAIEVINIVAPIIRQEQSRSRDEYVGQPLNRILWWQSMNVFPDIVGIDSDYLQSDQRITQKQRIQELLNDGELDYLTITGIGEDNWPRMMIYLSAKVQNYRDWEALVLSSDAIKSEGPYVDQKRWSYRKGNPTSATFGWNMNETWEHNELLTTILNGTARAMVAGTKQGIAAVASGPGPRTQSMVDIPGEYRSQNIFADKPRAIGRKQFKQGLDEPRLFTLAEQRRRTGYNADSIFYVFPNSASSERVPEDYVVVGGADYNTYVNIYNTENFVYRTANEHGQQSPYLARLLPNYTEMMLARVGDLEDVR